LLGILGKFKKADEWMEDGLAAALLGKYEEAISCFDEVLKMTPEYSWAWFGKGAALEKIGKYEEAISCFDEVIRIDPDDFLARYNKAMALEALGRFSEAKCLDEVNNR
jgi:tetratricopeptide (TPR) repeat protein